MTLIGPVLDDRTYEQLRDELVGRIPVYTPEWTDHNTSDPGIALLELFAHLGESLLFRFNQIPDATKVAFLRLLGLQPRPARPASVLLALQTDRPDGVQLLRDAVARAGDLPFRTTGEVYAWPLDTYAVGKKKVDDTTDEKEKARRLDAAVRATRGTPTTRTALTDDDVFFTLTPVPDDPMGPKPALDVGEMVDGSLWVALLARTPALRDSLTSALGGRTLFVGVAFDESLTPPPIALPLHDEARIRGVDLSADLLTSDPLPVLWELWDPGDTQRPAAMTTLTVDGDTTRGLATTGVVTLTLPPRLPALNPADEPSGDWNIPPPLDDAEQTQRLVGWLRARRPVGNRDTIRAVRWVGANAVEAVQSETAAPELLGTGTGDPGQTYALTRRPVVPGSLELEVEDVDGWHHWSAVDSLAGSGPLDAHYVVDPTTGLVTFGSGERGRSPAIGQRIRVLKYEVGGGAAGNVPAGAVTVLSNRGSVTVRNPLPAGGGADAASLVDALAEIPALVHRRDRAVVEEDFRALAREVAGVARAETLATFHPDTPTQAVAGVVSVVIFPRDDPRNPAAPEPDLALLRRVATYLNARRLLTTELYVLPPTYRRVAVSVSVRVRRGFQVDAVRRWVEQILRQYLAPLPDFGPDGAGWPLGQAIRRAELEAVAVQVDGVESVDGDLLLAVRDGEQWRPVERELPLSPWEVPALDVVTVVGGGTPLAAGEGFPPPPPEGTKVLMPLPPDVC